MVAGRARAVVVGIGSSTAMGSIRDSMLKTEDVRNMNTPGEGGGGIHFPEIYYNSYMIYKL